MQKAELAGELLEPARESSRAELAFQLVALTS